MGLKRNSQVTQAEMKASLLQRQATDLAFTGERYIPTEQGEIRLEHLHRYSAALSIVAGKKVLDIASGEGYGSFILATVADTVTGIDISHEAVRHARAAYRGRDNLIFEQGSATKINLPDRAFDVVISFETIEHLAEQSKMLSEIRRVLKPTGVLLISSPNRPVYSEASGNRNKFHVQELDFNEFDSLLREQFNAIHYLGQRLLIGSIVQPLDGATSSLRAMRDDGVHVENTLGKLSDPVYFLALCAATEAAIPVMDASILQPDKLDLLKQYVGFAKWAIDSNKELESLRKLHDGLNDEHRKVTTRAQSLGNQMLVVSEMLSEREQQIATLSDDAVKHGEWALGLEVQLEAANAEISNLLAKRDSDVARLVLVDKELGEIRERYAQLEQEHRTVDFRAHALDQQLATTARKLSEREELTVTLSAETAKQREWILNLERQSKSKQTELARVICDQDNQIEHLKQYVADLDGQVAKLDRDLIAAKYDLGFQKQSHLNDLKKNTLLFAQQKLQLLVAHSAKEKALAKEYAEHERRLRERLIAMQTELRKTDQEWTERYADLENQAACERADLYNQIKHLQDQTLESRREQAQFSVYFAEREQLLARESAERERTLNEQLVVAQKELSQVGHELAVKTKALQNELLDHRQSSATIQEQLLNQIGAAKQLAAHWEFAQDTLRFEMDNIRSSLAWRLTSPLRKFGLWGTPLSPNKPPASLQKYPMFSSANANLVDTRIASDPQDRTDRYLEEVSMTSKSFVPASYQDADIASLDDLLDFHGEDFVNNAYQTLLQRAPDAEGMAYYLGRLRRGVSKVQVLDQIFRSDEAQVRSVKLPGLEDALKRNRWLRLPIIGAMLRKQTASQRLHTLENQLVCLNELNGRHFNQIEKAIVSLSQLIVQQAQAAVGAAAIQRLGYASVDSWQTVEKLLPLKDKGFLESLFQSALGRSPEAHELKHYLHLLDKGVSKPHIIESIFSCTECKNWLAPAHFVEAQIGAKSIPQANTNDRSTEPVSVVAKSISFSEYETPLVSVVIPVYGKIEYTLMCLKSIQKQLPEVEFEIIIVDDKSPDNTAAELSKVSGINVLGNSNNLGFIRSCNRGARHARGRYICFLNNDTEVTAGWLDELVRTFDIFPGTGFVGSKLIYPDGTLQEAGGILWQDGSAWNFGRGQSPDLPVVNYAREVDYCSGASIIVPASLFSELGGFDEYYVPAYCEDSDLALKIRNSGYRVIYQPMSVVVHYEGITSGTDTGQGAKAYQVANSKKLFERWKRRLANHQPNAVNPDNAKDRRMKRRVLVLEHCTPTPDQDAGSVSVFNMLLLLREMDFQVTFIAEDNFLYMPDYTVMLQRAGIEVLYGPYVTSVVQHLQADGTRYDLVYLFRPVVVERHIESVRAFCPQAKVLFYTHDIHHIRMEREASLLASPEKAREAADMKVREFKAIRAVDSTIVVSTNEMETLQPQLPDQHLQMLPLLLDVPGTATPFDARAGIVFIGGYQHTPNVDAVTYFVSEVMPILRALLPGVRFHAVGSNPPPSVMALAADDVVIEGYVEDLKPLLDRMRISVAPLRYGAGVKGKVGTALASGLPTVATPIAAEGMQLTDGEQILIAESPQAFAKAILQIYTSEELWTRLSKSGVEFAERSWGATAVYGTFERIISNLGFPDAHPSFQLSLYSPNPHCKPCVAAAEERMHEF